ncbi:phage baseplate assembly protein (plasmid) [Orbus sturtevantii]|uniref:phage baseplate assembly protein domain-containing protein n=1 Tax=Orbus sturtevantii TaxID=3074109 RepID=UPI00370DA4E5
MIEEIKKLYRNIKMMIGIGQVVQVNDSGPIQIAQYQTALESKDNTPRIAEFGFSSSLPADSDVVMVFIGGDRTNGIIVASNHKESRYKDLKQGETVIYNQWGDHIILSKSGITVQANSKPVKIVTTATVEIDAPLLTVTGQVIDNTAGGNTETISQLRDRFNRHTHLVKNVASGYQAINSEVQN